MKPIDYREFIRKLKQFGFRGPYSGGCHPFMVRGDFDLTIPNPAKQIGGELLRRILRQAGISPREWEDKK